MKILRGIERRVQLAVRSVFRAMRRGDANASPELTNISRILVVRTDKIGDAVNSTPLFNVLRRAFPDAAIDLVLGRRNRVLAPLLPAPLFRHILFAPNKPIEAIRFARALRRNRYDLAINLLPNDSNTAALVTILSGARIKLGFANAASAFYDIVIPLDANAIPYARRTLSLASGLGIALPDEADAPLTLAIPPAASESINSIESDLRTAGRPVAMINISCTMPERFWGADVSARLARDLRAAGLEPVHVAPPSDVAAQQQIAAASAARAIAPRASLAEFVAILSCADLIVTPDTSVAHIAAALGKPTVMLAESTFKAVEGAPWRTPNRTLAGSGETVRDIPYETIIEAVLSLARDTVLPQPNAAVASKQ